MHRRNFIGGVTAAALAGSTAAEALAHFAINANSADGVLEIGFRRGDLVPGWMQRATHPGVFGVNVRWMCGSHSALRRRVPGYRPYDSTGTLLHAEEQGICLAVDRPLQPGECIVRFRGALTAVGGRREFRFHLRSGPGLGWIPASPGVHSWVDDSEDLLYYAVPSASQPARPWLRLA